MTPRHNVLIKEKLRYYCPFNISLLPKGPFCLQAVYMAGVVAASLGTSLSDPDTYIGKQHDVAHTLYFVVPDTAAERIDGAS
jgi:hypothetical protein